MSLRMLVTDDDPCLLGLYQTLFGQSSELKVDYAASPAACRAFCAMGRYDLALLDISLGDPDEDGIALLRWIRETRPETNVMMMSSMDSSDVVSRCLSLGAGAFTSKNRDFAQKLRASISSFVQKAPAAQAG